MKLRGRDGTGVGRVRPQHVRAKHSSKPYRETQSARRSRKRASSSSSPFEDVHPCLWPCGREKAWRIRAQTADAPATCAGEKGRAGGFGPENGQQLGFTASRQRLFDSDRSGFHFFGWLVCCGLRIDGGAPFRFLGGSSRCCLLHRSRGIAGLCGRFRRFLCRDHARFFRSWHSSVRRGRVVARSRRRGICLGARLAPFRGFVRIGGFR